MTESIGQQLRQEREERKLSLEQVSKATHIRLRYLQALEKGEMDALPSLVQVRGFLRAYAGYLRIDVEPLLALLDGSPAAEPLPEPAPVEPASEVGEDAGQIFSSVGNQLQERRELLGLSLDDVERHTHLRVHYLQALEAGRLDQLPSPVQGRGMLNNYAVFLGMDSEPLLLQFADGLQARFNARQAERPQTKRRPAAIKPVSPLRRLFSSEMLIYVFLVVSLGVFMVWAAVRIFAIRAEEQPSPTAPSIAEVLLSPPTATQTPTLLPPTPTAPQLPEAVQPEATQIILPGAQQEGVSVYVTVQQRAWIRVLIDGKLEYEGRVLPGSAYVYSGNRTVDILTGNAAGLQIFFQQQDLGAMGLFGQVVERIYTAEGIQTPTPTVTPTITPTPRQSPTPTPTAAP